MKNCPMNRFTVPNPRAFHYWSVRANCMWWFENGQCNSSDAVGRLSLW